MDHNHSHEHHDHVHHEENLTKEYVKLIAVFISMFIISLVLRNFFGARKFMEIFMGVFFLVFAGFKLFNLKAFVDAYTGYDVIAKRFRAYALAYPFIEVVLGIGSLLAIHFTNYFIVAFMIIGSIGVGQELFRQSTSHSHLKCACLGDFIKLPLTTVSLAEDVVMLVMAVVSIFAN